MMVLFWALDSGYAEICYICKVNGVLAQLVERKVRNLEVRSSILLCSTKQTKNQSLKALTHKFTHKTCEIYA